MTITKGKKYQKINKYPGEAINFQKICIVTKIEYPKVHYDYINGNSNCSMILLDFVKAFAPASKYKKVSRL